MRQIKEEGWKERLNRSADRGAVVIVAMDEMGRIPIVYDKQKEGINGEPTYWKFPGGKIDPSDKNEQTAALRELAEETGVRPVRDILFRVGVIRKQTHDLIVFLGLSSLENLHATGDEGEKVRKASVEQIREMIRLKPPTFFPNHVIVLDMVEKYLKNNN
jgi:8-oxo-dGTP pyrophosphatase MutT (NUDIX family)